MALRRRSCLLACALLLGCGGKGDDDDAPHIELGVGPAMGLAPLTAAFDASASRDDTTPISHLSFHWDFEGDGVWDEVDKGLAQRTFVYAQPGLFRPRLAVTDTAGNEATFVADAIAVLSGQAVPLEIVAESGMLPANVDDDDQDGVRDGADDVINGDTDAADTTALTLKQAPVIATHRIALAITPPGAAARARLFVSANDGFAPVTELGVGEGEIDWSTLAGGDVVLRLEAVAARSGSWDGRVSVRARVSEGGAIVGEVSRELRVAPVLFPDNTQAATRVYAMRIAGDNNAFFDALTDELPMGVHLYDVDSARYERDRWVQDNMQVGYQEIATASGRRSLRHYLQAERTDRPLEPFLPHELLGPDLAYSYPGGVDSSHNYGGNLEVTPPFAGAPFGRIIIGGGDVGTLTGFERTDRMTRPQRDWLAAQEVQAPTLEVSTEWLVVGHVDEIFQFIPAPNSTTGKTFKLVMASPDLARAALTAIAVEHADAEVFAGRRSETTVAEILDDEELLAFNDAAQARIDGVREAVTELMGLVEEDIIDVPVLFEEVFETGVGFGVAYSPGVQNLVTVNDILFIPDPEGPDVDGEDVWQRQILDALLPLGVTVHFVDVFESYHELFGEAHCGTNVELAAYDTPWWAP